VSESFLVEVQFPDDLARFQLSAGVQSRLQDLLDRQDAGQPLTDAERSEAEGLVNVAELLTWLRLRTELGRVGRAEQGPPAAPEAVGSATVGLEDSTHPTRSGQGYSHSAPGISTAPALPQSGS
jgi:hypothetical protein